MQATAGAVELRDAHTALRSRRHRQAAHEADADAQHVDDDEPQHGGEEHREPAIELLIEDQRRRHGRALRRQRARGQLRREIIGAGEEAELRIRAEDLLARRRRRDDGEPRERHER